MIADIRNKLNGSRLKDRLEDNLTGNFFGIARYLRQENGLRAVLKNIDCDLFENALEQFYKSLEQDIKYGKDSFWPSREEGGEIDLMIELDDALLGIEIKLDSGLSSDDPDPEEISEDKDEHSKNQLIKYANMINRLKKIKNKKYAYLIFIAPSEKKYIYQDILNNKLKLQEMQNSKINFFGFLSWEQIYRNLKEIKNILKDKFPDDIIIEDLMELLKQKGYDTFSGFKKPECEVNLIGWNFKGALFSSYILNSIKITKEGWNYGKQ